MTAKRIVNDTVYESYPSKAKRITVKLAKPSVSALTSSSGRNTLKWKAVSKASGYKIYCRVSGTSKWKLIGTTKLKNYTDKNAACGTKYEYRIRAYRTTYKNTVYSSYSAKRTVRTR